MTGSEGPASSLSAAGVEGAGAEGSAADTGAGSAAEGIVGAAGAEGAGAEGAGWEGGFSASFAVSLHSMDDPAAAAAAATAARRAAASAAASAALFWNQAVPQLEHCTSRPEAGMALSSTSYCALQLGQISRIFSHSHLPDRFSQSLSGLCC